VLRQQAAQTHGEEERVQHDQQAEAHQHQRPACPALESAVQEAERDRQPLADHPQVHDTEGEHLRAHGMTQHHSGGRGVAEQERETAPKAHQAECRERTDDPSHGRCSFLPVRRARAVRIRRN
jgi:hypothetical protein